jgi:formate dehydrogenase major subunit
MSQPAAPDRRAFLRTAAGGVAAGGMLALGFDLRAAQAETRRFKFAHTREVPSVCPYCAVGCGTLVHSRERTPGKKDWQIINIEGNPDNPINGGTLCPKGAASFQLAVNPNRQTTVKYRAPGATTWRDLTLAEAMDMVADRVKKTRDATFKAKDTFTIGGQAVEKNVNRTTAIATLGGATMDNEWNYVHTKLMRSLGVVYVENQARI